MNWLGSKTVQDKLQRKCLYIDSFPNKQKFEKSEFPLHLHHTCKPANNARVACK